jgi:hypothetical protein
MLRSIAGIVARGCPYWQGELPVVSGLRFGDVRASPPPPNEQTDFYPRSPCVDELIVVHAGNMGVKQGLENVVAAARLAATEMPAGTIRFVLLGDGNQRCRLQKEGVGVASLEFIKPLPDWVFRATLHAADVLLVNEKPSRSGCQLMTVKSRAAHASDSEWSELCWASSGRRVSSPRCGRREYSRTE